MPQNLTCPDQARLLNRCALAESDSNRAIQFMVARIGTLKEQPSYEELHEFAETARQLVEDARAALRLHTTEHGC